MNRAPKAVQHRDQTDIVLDRAGVLEAEKDRGAPRLARSGDVARVEALKDQVGEGVEPAVPRFDIQHRFAEGLVIGDGDMHRVHPARAHLAKDFLGPVGILQTVDKIHAGRSGSARPS